jgi:hypothetical protein
MLSIGLPERQAVSSLFSIAIDDNTTIIFAFFRLTFVRNNSCPSLT